MPLLWEVVQMWAPGNVTPYTLFKYPLTMGRVSPYIRTMHLLAGAQDNMDKTTLNRTWKFASRCLQILTVATSVKSLRLYIYFSDVDSQPPQFRNKLKGVNDILFRILRHAETMDLDELIWNPGPGTVHVPDALKIIERKVTSMRLCHLECGDWVDQLPNHERLRSIDTYNSRPQESNEFDAKFWTAISRLDNCISVTTGDIPIPFGWSIPLENITNLNLLLLCLIDVQQWINTVTAVLKYMPKLETVRLPSSTRFTSQPALDSIVISDVACKNLRSLHLSGISPSRLLVTIGNQCPNLAYCHFDLHNVNDDDLYSLSQCSHIRRFSLQYPNPIKNGLKYLTNLRQLTYLGLHYSLGRHINTQLLLDFARLCPRLDHIHVADFNDNRRPADPKTPFDTEDISELFAAGSELRAYFEPHHKTPSEWTAEGLEKYLIRIDNLRRDRLSL